MERGRHLHRGLQLRGRMPLHLLLTSNGRRVQGHHRRHIDKGCHGDTSLDGLNAALIVYTPT
jgi:hypothetical protein